MSASAVPATQGPSRRGAGPTSTAARPSKAALLEGRGTVSLGDPRAIQILATEHWSLLASRALSWNESFSRASMLLAALSAAVVSLALVAQVAAFGQGFIVFAVVALPFVEFLGLATFARLGEANAEDVRYIQGMNRIRHAYLEMAPQLEPYIVTSANDDLPAVYSAYGIAPVEKYSVVRRRLHHAFVTTQGLVGVLNSMLAGVFGGLVGLLAGAPLGISVVAGGVVLGIAFAAQMAYGVSIYERSRAELTVRFPSRGTARAGDA
jgi:hypothetical protein